MIKNNNHVNVPLLDVGRNKRHTTNLRDLRLGGGVDDGPPANIASWLT